MRIAPILGLAALAASQPAFAAELSYRWEKGQTHHFQAKSKDTMTMSGMGIDMTARFNTDVTFAMAVNKVRKTAPPRPHSRWSLSRSRTTEALDCRRRAPSIASPERFERKPMPLE